MQKEPEVIIFQEPLYSRRKRREVTRERDKFMSGDVSEIFKSDEKVQDKQSKSNAEPSNSQFDLKETLREVQCLAASVSSGKTKRKFEEDQIRALGAKPAKPDYVPFPHYQAMAKARREKEKKLAEELSGSQKRRKVRGSNLPVVKKGKSRWKDNITSLEPGLGKFKNGLLTLNSRDLAKINKK